jgi:hypothetical protein
MWCTGYWLAGVLVAGFIQSDMGKKKGSRFRLPFF